MLDFYFSSQSKETDAITPVMITNCLSIVTCEHGSKWVPLSKHGKVKVTGTGGVRSSTSKSLAVYL